jgi:hypothetical protein
LQQSAAGCSPSGRMIYLEPEAAGNLHGGEAFAEYRCRLLPIPSFDFKTILTGRRLWPFDERCA